MRPTAQPVPQARREPGCLSGCLLAMARLTWRYRWQLAPLWIALGAEGTAMALITLWPVGPYTPIYAWLGGLTLTAAGGLWAIGPRVGLTRAIERAYAAGLSVAVGGYVGYAYWFGSLANRTLEVWAIATLALGGPWWWHRRIRAKREDPIKQATSDWAELAPKLGLDGVEVVGQRAHPDGRWTISFLLPRWMTVHDFRQRVREGKLDVAFDLRQRACRIEEIPGRARRVDVHVDPVGKAAGPLKPPPLPRVVSVLDPIVLAEDEHGRQIAVRTHDRHMLLGASTGGGKSSVIHTIMRWWGRAIDGLVYGIDMGGGSTLGAWRNRIRKLTTDARTGVDLLAWGVQEMERRLATLGDSEDDTVRVGPERPAIKFIIDEYDELVAQEPEAAEHVDTIVRRGRKACVTVLLTSLRPTKEALGSKAIRQQLSIRIQLPVIEARDADLILGDGMRPRGWDPRLLDEPGKMLIFAPPEHAKPHPYKGYWVSKADAVALDREYAQRYPLPQLGLVSTDSPADSPRVSPPDSPSVGPAGNGHAPTVTLPVPGPDREATLATERGLRRQIVEALAAAGERGARADDLAAQAGCSRASAFNKLTELEAAGRVVRDQPERGRWRLT